MQVGRTSKSVGCATVVIAFGWLLVVSVSAAATAPQLEKVHSAARAITKAETLYKSGKMTEAIAAFGAAQKSLADLAEETDLSRQLDPLVKRLNNLHDSMVLDGAKLPDVAAELVNSSEPTIAAGRSSAAPGESFPVVTPSSTIRIWVDQIGYRTQGNKMAVIASDTALPDNPQIELRDEKTGRAVWKLSAHPTGSRNSTTAIKTMNRAISSTTSISRRSSLPVVIIWP